MNDSAKLPDNSLYFAKEAWCYREFKPTKDCIEYTIYWVEDGVKQRMDLEVTAREMERTVNPENWVRDKIEMMYELGQYVPATEYAKNYE